MSVQTGAVLETATRVLLADPAASLADVARAAGISRTSLYTLYPTRAALLVALAHEAMDLVDQAYAQAELDAGEPVAVVLRRLVELVMPFGPRMEFLLRERSLDIEPDVVARYQALDQPLIDLIMRAQVSGALNPALPAWWVAAALWGTVYSAWEAVADGRLARRDAPELVLTTVLHGLIPR
ncbi:MAG: TetR/AcrR family transcriptional regulator [Pseudonocardiaceae bacterium]